MHSAPDSNWSATTYGHEKISTLLSNILHRNEECKLKFARTSISNRRHDLWSFRKQCPSLHTSDVIDVYRSLLRIVHFILLRLVFVFLICFSIFIVPSYFDFSGRYRTCPPPVLLSSVICICVEYLILAIAPYSFRRSFCSSVLLWREVTKSDISILVVVTSGRKMHQAHILRLLLSIHLNIYIFPRMIVSTDGVQLIYQQHDTLRTTSPSHTFEYVGLHSSPTSCRSSSVTIWIKFLTFQIAGLYQSPFTDEVT